MDPGSAAHRKGAAQHPGNAPSKLRRAFFREGLDAFLDLGAPHAVAMAAVGGLLIQPVAGEFVDRALHAAHRGRRVAGENAGELIDLLVERLGRHHRCKIADPQHLRGADFFCGQEQPLGVVDAKPRHIALDAALVVMQPEPRRWHEHLAGVDADTEIAGQRQVGRAAIDAAVEPADRRQREILKPVDDDLERRSGGLLLCVGRAFGDRAEIIPGTEGAAGAGQHQNPERGIGLDPVEQFYQRVEILRLQPVQMLRPVEADGGARAVDVEHRRARRITGTGGMPLHHLFSSARRLASASMVSARSGCRAISMRKSTRSSTRSFDTRVVVILAERKLLPSSAISPKNAPSPSLTFLPGKSTSTSPSAMKYMQSPVLPLRMIMVRAGRSMVRSIWVTSAIAAGPSAAKNGTLLTDSQVFRKLSRRVSAAKPVARIPVHSPNTPRPQIITSAATSLPSGVIGTTSPYPTVVRVAIAHHKAAGTLPKVAGWTSRSREYTDTEARNNTIRKITSTLNSGPDSSTSTRRNCRKPGIPGTTLNIQKMPSSQAVFALTPRIMATGTPRAPAASTRPRPDVA